MGVDFGKIERYLGDRGFGFVSHIFAKGGKSKVFFHIRTVKQFDPAAAEVIAQAALPQSISFWYEYGQTDKGEQVVKVLDVEDLAKYDTSAIAESINRLYLDVKITLSDEIARAAEDFLSKKELSKLVKQRGKLQEEKNRIDEEHRVAQLLKTKQAQGEMLARFAQEQVEDGEFRALVVEISAQNFSQSKQVSNYIVAHRLGYKYKNISGVLEMESNGRIWGFEGGFPPKIYARLCRELGLSNQGTDARPGVFIPYKNLPWR